MLLHSQYRVLFRGRFSVGSAFVLAAQHEVGKRSCMYEKLKEQAHADNV